MHTASTYVRLSVRGRRGGGFAARADTGFIGPGIASTLGLVERRGGHQVLHNGTVDDVLEGGRLRARGRRLGDDSTEDRVLSERAGHRG